MACFSAAGRVELVHSHVHLDQVLTQLETQAPMGFVRRMARWRVSAMPSPSLPSS